MTKFEGVVILRNRPLTVWPGHTPPHQHTPHPTTTTHTTPRHLNALHHHHTQLKQHFIPSALEQEQETATFFMQNKHKNWDCVLANTMAITDVTSSTSFPSLPHLSSVTGVCGMSTGCRRWGPHCLFETFLIFSVL